MKALRLAISFLLVPRLFASLILFPLVLSILVVLVQIFVTRLILGGINREAQSFGDNVQQLQQKSVVRFLIYGKAERLPKIRICRWIMKELRDGDFLEIPPGKDCSPNRLDVALRVPNPETFDITKYTELLDGTFEILHICRERCKPDVVITPGSPESRADVFSAFGMMLLNDARFGSMSRKEFVEGVKDLEDAQNILGTRYLHSAGLRAPISFKYLYTSMAVILNVALLIITALWLALKAHRKVLDYFARSGVLLPMVAATGNGNFYSAIWLLTFFRVGAFLIAAVPITVSGISGGLPETNEPLLFGESTAEAILWLLAISISMGLATLIASIAELKHRHTLLSIAYKFVPLVLSGIGTVIWGATFVFETDWSSTLRDIVSSTPLFGLAPMILAPVFKPKFGVFVLHTLLATALAAYAARCNARWFAAHLEEI